MAPENTIPAFLAAAELGVTTLELDVVVSRDSQIVVSHEPWMSHVICADPAGNPVPEDPDRFNLFRLSADEIARFDCGGRGHPDYPEQDVRTAAKPLLSAVLDTIEARFNGTDRPRLHYNIETKTRPSGDGVFHPDPEAFVRLLEAVLSSHNLGERAVVQSFDVRTLQAYRRRRPERRLALLVGNDADPEARIDALGFIPDILSPHYLLVDAALVEAAHARGMEVIPWTVNNPTDMRRMIRLGVDGLITDYPNRFVDTFGVPARDGRE